jgi:hypothetical protein
MMGESVVRVHEGYHIRYMTAFQTKFVKENMRSIADSSNLSFIHIDALRLRLVDLREKLALVGTGEETHPSLGDLVKAGLNNVLALISNSELALGDALLEDLQVLSELISEIQDDEALDLDSHSDDFEPVLQAGEGIAGAVVVGDRTASSDAAELGHASEHQVENLAANVVEVDVDVVGSGLLQVGGERRGLVVQALVGAEGLDPFTLLVSTSNADDTLAADQLLGNLNGHAASGTCGT